MIIAHCEQMPSSAKGKKDRAEKLPTQIFLGQKTCAVLWEDMSHTILPSWVGAVPPHVGNGKHRKLNADQLKVLGTIHLVITLIPLWSSFGGIFFRLLENFMDLIESIRLATSHTVSMDSIFQYDETVHRYLRGMVTLFPGAPITPLQHGMTHFQQFMKDFGPSRDWNCFPFERMNGDCQKVNHNGHPGVWRPSF